MAHEMAFMGHSHREITGNLKLHYCKTCLCSSEGSPSGLGSWLKLPNRYLGVLAYCGQLDPGNKYM
jgi:hypothetical protein